jgi:hypothetical protein
VDVSDVVQLPVEEIKFWLRQIHLDDLWREVLKKELTHRVSQSLDESLGTNELRMQSSR